MKKTIMSVIKLLFIAGMGIILYSCNNTNIFDTPKSGKLGEFQRAKRSSDQELAIDKTVGHGIILPEEFDSLTSLISTFWYYAMSGPEIRVGVSPDLALQFQLNLRHYYNQDPTKFNKEFLDLKLEDLQQMMALSKPIWANLAFTDDLITGGIRSKRYVRPPTTVQEGNRWEKLLDLAVKSNDKALSRVDRQVHGSHSTDTQAKLKKQVDWVKKMKSTLEHVPPSTPEELKKQVDWVKKMKSTLEHVPPSTPEELKKQAEWAKKMKSTLEHVPPSTPEELKKQAEWAKKTKSTTEHVPPSTPEELEEQAVLAKYVKSILEHAPPSTPEELEEQAVLAKYIKSILEHVPPSTPEELEEQAVLAKYVKSILEHAPPSTPEELEEQEKLEKKVKSILKKQEKLEKKIKSILEEQEKSEKKIKSILDKDSHSTGKGSSLVRGGASLVRGILTFIKSSVLMVPDVVYKVPAKATMKIMNPAIHATADFIQNVYNTLKYTSEAIQLVKSIFQLEDHSVAEKIANANLLDDGLLVLIGDALASGLMEKEDLGNVVVTTLHCSGKYKEHVDKVTGKRFCYDTRPKRSSGDDYIMDGVSTIDQLNNYLPEHTSIIGVFQLGVSFNGAMGQLPVKAARLGNAYKIQVNVHPGRTETLKNGEKRVVMRVKIFLRTELSAGISESYPNNTPYHVDPNGKIMIARLHGIDIPLIRNEDNSAWVTYDEGINYLETILLRMEAGLEFSGDNFISRGESLIEETLDTGAYNLSKFFGALKGNPHIGVENGWNFHWDFKNRSKAVSAMAINISAMVAARLAGTIGGLFVTKDPKTFVMIGDGVSAVVEGITLALETSPGSPVHPDKISCWIGMTFGLEGFFSGKRATLADQGATFRRYLVPKTLPSSVGGITLRRLYAGNWEEMAPTDKVFRQYAKDRLRANGGIKSSNTALSGHAMLLFVLAKDWVIFKNADNEKTINFDVD